MQHLARQKFCVIWAYGPIGQQELMRTSNTIFLAFSGVSLCPKVFKQTQ